MRESKTVPDDFMDLIKTFNIGSYFDPLSKIREKLEFKNCSQAEVEALLINTIVNFYDNDKNRFKTDIVLVAFGLLKGFDNRPRTNDIEFSVGKSLYTKRIKKFHERTNYNLTGNKLSAIEKCVKRELGILASEIYAKKGDNKHLRESAKKYPSPRKDYIPEENLPDMFYYQWVENGSAQAPVLSAGYYIKKIRTSTSHDDVAVDLYKTLCGDGEPPYANWVAAWILKCIRETFKDTIDTDIMLASFALLDDYHLNGENGLKHRLDKYLEDSLYIDTHPGRSRCSSFVDMGQTEINLMKEKLAKRESRLVDELIVNIENISNKQKHIKELGKYGTFEDKLDSYSPNQTGMRFLKRKFLFIEDCIKELQAGLYKKGMSLCLTLFLLTGTFSRSAILAIIELGANENSYLDNYSMNQKNPNMESVYIDKLMDVQTGYIQDNIF